MYEWNEAIQKMIDWIEANITENPTLIEISQQIGYSPYYCSIQFHKICGMTIKNYVSGRRLALAAVALRDTDEKIIDIAVKYGFSSQEALTRAFRSLFGCTPATYRRNPVPVPLPIYKTVIFPEHYQKLHKGELEMSDKVLAEPIVKIQYIPAHKYIGIWDKNAENYCNFVDSKHSDCLYTALFSPKIVSVDNRKNLLEGLACRLGRCFCFAEVSTGHPHPKPLE